MLHTILNFLASLFSALSRAADASTSDPVSTVDTQSAAPPGWEGAPPYRYIDVSRYQAKSPSTAGAKLRRRATRGHAQDREHQPQAFQAGRRAVHRPHF